MTVKSFRQARQCVVCFGIILILISATTTDAGPPRGGNRRTSVPRSVSPSPKTTRSLSSRRAVDPSSSTLTRSTSTLPSLGTRSVAGGQNLSSLLEPTTMPPRAASRELTTPSRGQLEHFLRQPVSQAAPADFTRQSLHEAQGTLSSSPEPRRADVTNSAQTFQQDLQGYLADQPDPFSPAWYADHPNAWQYTSPHADAWAIATWGAINVWVSGYNASPNPYLVSSGTYTSVPTYDVPTDQGQRPATEPPAVPVDHHAEEWLPLGVFGLIDASGQTTPMVLQVAIHRDGKLAGTYFNADSNVTQPLSGQLDASTQQVHWTVNDNPAVVFETPLVSFTESEADVTLRFANDITETWQLVRLESPSPSPPAESSSR